MMSEATTIGEKPATLGSEVLAIDTKWYGVNHIRSNQAGRTLFLRKIQKCPIFRTFITFRWFWAIIDVSKQHGLHLVNLGCIVVHSCLLGKHAYCGQNWGTNGPIRLDVLAVVIILIHAQPSVANPVPQTLKWESFLYHPCQMNWGGIRIESHQAWSLPENIYIDNHSYIFCIFYIACQENKSPGNSTWAQLSRQRAMAQRRRGSDGAGGVSTNRRCVPHGIIWLWFEKFKTHRNH